MPRYDFQGRTVQLSYTTNVHPALDLQDVMGYLQAETARVREQVAPDRPFGVTLHLPPAAIHTLRATPRALGDLRRLLDRLQLEVVGLNGFPLGDFHAGVVKQEVYRPDWCSRERVDLTIALAELLADLRPGSGPTPISTLAGGDRAADHGPEVLAHQARNLTEVALALARLEDRTGCQLLLGLEPEAGTSLETLPETLVFFQEHLEPVAQTELGPGWRRYLGLNLDLCHQAVQFEDLPAGLDALAAAGITLGSVHATAALRVPHPDPDRLARLAAFAEPRWLHQVVGADAAGRVVLRRRDLPALQGQSPEELAGVTELRCHFHVPLGATEVGGLPTTAPLTVAALRHILQHDLTRQIVAETYTWGSALLPTSSLPDALAAELRWLAERAGLQAPAAS